VCGASNEGDPGYVGVVGDFPGLELDDGWRAACDGSMKKFKIQVKFKANL